MQFTILSLFCATLLNGSRVEADVKECQDIKSKFLDCTTKAHETFKEQIVWGVTVGLILPRGSLVTIWRAPFRHAEAHLKGNVSHTLRSWRWRIAQLRAYSNSWRAACKSGIKQVSCCEVPHWEAKTRRWRGGSFLRIKRKFSEQQPKEGGGKLERGRHWYQLADHRPNYCCGCSCPACFAGYPHSLVSEKEVQRGSPTRKYDGADEGQSVSRLKKAKTFVSSLTRSSSLVCHT